MTEKPKPWEIGYVHTERTEEMPFLVGDTVVVERREGYHPVPHLPDPNGVDMIVDEVSFHNPECCDEEPVVYLVGIEDYCFSVEELRLVKKA